MRTREKAAALDGHKMEGSEEVLFIFYRKFKAFIINPIVNLTMLDFRA
jgi:hypothetical protein